MFFLFKAAKRGPSPGVTSEDLKQLPALMRESVSIREHDEGRIQVAYASRPGENAVSIVTSGSRLLVLSGYARRMGESRFLTAEEVLHEIAQGRGRFGGQYAAVLYDGAERTVRTFTTLARLIPIYVRDEKSFLTVSNRQAVFACAGDAGGIDEEAFTPFFGQGYLPHERSLFKGVQLSPADSQVSWDLRGVASAQVTQLSSVLDDLGQRVPDEESFDNVAASLQRAFIPIASEMSINIGLSGGRDSRLIAAALKAAGVDFTTYTRSPTFYPEQDPEVIAARSAAEVLDLPHTVTPPHAGSGAAPEAGVQVDLVQRLIDVAVNTDYSVFGHETLNASPRTYNVSSMAYNGGGGELLRQAYGANAWRSKERAVQLLRAHADGEGWGLSDTWYQQWLDQWIEGRHARNPGALLNTFSLLYRTGRWGSGVYAAQYSKVNQRPFYDNELLTHLLPIDSAWTASDVVYYEALRRLAPSLLEVPFAGKRAWGLDQAPSEVHRRKAGHLPAPLGDLPGHGGMRQVLPWRQQIDGPLGEALLDLIARSASRSGLFSTAYVQRLRETVRRKDPGKKTPRLTKRLWASASAAVMVAHLSGDEETYARGVVTRIPS